MAAPASMGSIRSPFISRSWVLTPSYLHHRAGKHIRSHTTLTYRVYAEIPHHNIPRNADPYQLRNAYPDRPNVSTKPSSKPMRPFDRSHRYYSTKSNSGTSRIPHISVHIAAASSGKGSKYKPEKSTYDYDPTNSPPALGLQNPDHDVYKRRRARPDSGQDAYFVAPVGDINNHMTAFGVCDGVGGWSDHGVDPADFSHGLCSYMAKTAIEWPAASTSPSTFNSPSTSTPSKSDDSLTPQHLLELGYNLVVRDPTVKAGGSTACIGIVDSTGRARIANLGDSGFLQLRLGTVHHYSNPQTHAFNTPYQMSLTPPEILAQAMIFGGLPLNDLPSRADTADHMLRHGDVLVFATDGVWDNLSSQDVLTSVSNTMRNTGAWKRTDDRGYIASDNLSDLVVKDSAIKAGLPGTLQSVLAASIAGEAKSASMNRKRDGPFAKAWKMHAPYDPYHGGKVDDISVLVIVPVDRRLGGGANGGEEERRDSEVIKAKL